MSGWRAGLIGLALLAAIIAAAVWLLEDEAPVGAPERTPPAPVVAPADRTDAIPLGEPDRGSRAGLAEEVSVPARLPVQGDTLSVLVTRRARDGSIRPVAGADVLPVIDGQAGVRHKTDATGRVSFPWGDVAAAVLEVRAPGCFPHTSGVDDLAQAMHSGGELEVRLVRSYQLQGKVGAWGPDPVPAGLGVLAWSAVEPPSRADVWALLERERLGTGSAEVALEPPRSDVMLTRTQYGGGYRFPRRVPAGEWNLQAAGLGRATFGATSARAEHGKGIPLTSWSAHTLAVQVTDQQGAPILETPGLSQRTTSWPAGSKLQYTAFDPFERLLLGIEAPANWGPVKLIDVRAPVPAPSAGPVSLNFKEPGFEKASVSLDVPSTRGGLLLHTIVLTPTWEELGELTVILDGWDAHVGELITPPSVALILTGDELARQHIYLTDLQDDQIHLEGIPHGTWKARLDIDDMYGVPKVTEAVVISAAPATLRIDLTHFASLDIELVTEDGTLYEGHADIIMGFAEGPNPGAGYYHAFKRPPYRIPFVSHHKWKPHLQGAYGLKNGLEARARAPVVELSPGETGSVQLVIGGS